MKSPFEISVSTTSLFLLNDSSDVITQLTSSPESSGRLRVTSSNDLFRNVANFSDVTTPEIYVRPFTDTAIIVSAAILLSFLVFGLIANIMTIIVISTTKSLRNVFSTFIVSLCASDLWSALISWLCLYRRTWGFDVWSPIPDVFCRFYWASDLATSYATALHIFSFSILRFISIQFPLQFSKISIMHTKIWIACIWVTTFSCGFIPFFIFFDARPRDRLSDSPDARWPACTITSEWYDIYLVYQTIGYSIFFYAPTAGVLITTVLIIAALYTRLSKMGSKRKKKETQAVVQLTLIVVSYLIGYIPFTAYEFWSVQPRPNTLYYRHFDYWFGMVQYYFLRFSECLNPIFYNLGSSKMRHHTIAFIEQKICRKAKQKQGNLSSTASSAMRISRQMSSPL